MKFSEQQLRTWINPNLDREALGELLTMSGLEIEACEPVAPPFSGVVVGRVCSVRKHENADRLRVCEVDVGAAERLQIVCGAPNVREGLHVPCAMIGAVLPGDFKIKSTKMRGELSQGMLCSGKELGIFDEVDGLLELPESAPVGMNVRDYLALDDSIFELKITPNRADCLSLFGIARELAALTGAPLNVPTIAECLEDASIQNREIEIQSSNCGRYLGRVIELENPNAPSPDWLKQALLRVGLRSISAIVDVTNFVMLELGQPLHAFDHETLNGKISVRQAKSGETLTLLNDKTVELDDSFLVIADESGAVALAGVMGGKATEVSERTRTVFLESAYFAPEAISGRARQLGLNSDAAFRYERGVDFELQARAMARATALILDICGGKASAVHEVLGQLPERAAVRVRVERVNRLLGLKMTARTMQDLLSRLNIQVDQVIDSEEEILVATPPSFRFDLNSEEDFMEEVARLFGYDHIPSECVEGRLAMLPVSSSEHSRISIKQHLVARAYQEVITYAFVEPRWEHDFAGEMNPIVLKNPIASHLSVMRSSLIGGLVNVLRENVKRQQTRVRIFEVARVFLPDGQGGAREQPERIAALAFGDRDPEQWGLTAERVDFFDVKADIEALLAPRRAEFRTVAHPAMHPGRSAEIWVDGEAVGIVGELHPKWVQAYDLPFPAVIFEMSLSAVLKRVSPRIQAVSKFPLVRRDLALLVDESLTMEALFSSLRAAALPFVQEISLFDLYRGKGVPEGKKSIAFKVLMQDTARTLTDVELEEAMNLLLAAAEKQGAQLRV